jgi:hypothetical protein
VNKVYIKDNELKHFGVKGMRWGVRKDRSGSTKRTQRMAKKDAKR